MAALVFFTSLFLLAALLAVMAVSRLSSGAHRTRGSKRGNKAGQATRKPRQKRQPRQAGGGAAKSSRAASGATRKRLRWPNIPVPPELLSCLPLGLLFSLMVGVGQLALYGLQQSHEGAVNDSRLVALDSALDYLGVAALALLVLGVIGAIATHRRKP